MKKEKLLICLLSTTLVLPSYTAHDVSAETSKEQTAHSKGDETEPSDSPQLIEKKQTPKKDAIKMNGNSDKSKASKKETVTRSKQQTEANTVNHEDTPSESNSTERTSIQDFSSHFDFLKPAPLRNQNNSFSNWWTKWFSLPDTVTPKQQSALFHQDTAPSNDNDELSNTSSVDNHTDTQTDSDTHTNQSAQNNETISNESDDTPQTSQTKEDNSTLSPKDQDVLNQLDHISSTVQSQKEDSSKTTETAPSNNEHSSPEQDAKNKETESSQNDASDTIEASSNADDRILESVLDEYSKKAKDTHNKSQSQTDKPAQLVKSVDKNKTPSQNQNNPQLPSKAQMDKREAPKQSFEDGLNQSNVRSTATFQLLPDVSNTQHSSGDYTISDNKNTRDFVKKIAKSAHDVGQKQDLYASVMIAQAILESDSGNSALARSPHYNLFGIKGNYQGKSANFNTLEDNGSTMYQISASFRSYPSEKESLADYADLMKHGIDGNPSIYQPTWKNETISYRDATAHLARTYATDSHYADKLNSIIKHYNLTQFDKEKMPDLTHYTPSETSNRSDFKPFTEAGGNSPYPSGQCTWYVYQRMAQFGQHIGGDLGDARNWDNRAQRDGYTLSSNPKTHSAVVFEAGQQDADAIYGHVAFVEKVNKDGSIVISESNVQGLGVISYRTIDADDASELTYIDGKY